MAHQHFGFQKRIAQWNDSNIIKPKILVERHAWNKMKGWCNAATSEVSGYGLVRPDNGTLTVYDAFLLKQYCSSAYTEVDDKTNILFQKKLFQWGRDMTHYRLWWHTHYNFNAFWSGTDDTLANLQPKINGEWGLSIVINQAGDYKCRLDSMRRWGKKIDVIHDLDVFMVNNEKRHKRKRNFKQDIKRWVHSMDEMPEYQKNKGIVREDEKPTVEIIPQYANRVYDYPVSNTPNYEGMEDWWQGWHNKNNSEKQSEEPITVTNPIPVAEGSAIEEKVEDWTKQDNERQKHTATYFGHRAKYVLYEGKLYSKEAFDRLVGCHCIDGTCIDCLEVKNKEHGENNVGAIQEPTPDDGSGYAC